MKAMKSWPALYNVALWRQPGSENVALYLYYVAFDHNTLDTAVIDPAKGEIRAGRQQMCSC